MLWNGPRALEPVEQPFLDVALVALLLAADLAPPLLVGVAELLG